MRLNSSLVYLAKAAIEGKLAHTQAVWHEKPALGVVMAAVGYPNSYDKGAVIKGLNSELTTEVKVFHAGTEATETQTVTAGGRVLCVTALGHDVHIAQQNAYEAVKQISWEGVQYRNDIGYRAIERLNAQVE